MTFKKKYNPGIFAGIEMNFLADGSISYNLSILTREKGNLKKQQEYSGVELDEIALRIKKSTPVILVMNGKGIIHKKITNLSERDENKLLQKVLPSANPQDFYLQITDSAGSDVFVSVIRKPLVDAQLEKLRMLGVEVICCSLGPFIIQAVLNLFALAGNGFYELNFATHRLIINDGVIEDYTAAESIDVPYKIGDELIPSPHILTFTACVVCLIYEKPSPLANIPSLHHAHNEFIHKRDFQFLVKAFLVFFLVVLLVNYLFFDHYWNKSKIAATQLESYHEAVTRYNSLDTEFRQKQVFLENSGLLDHSRLSYYTDQLLADMPQYILLTQLYLNPQGKKTDDNKLVFTMRKITISGICKYSAQINEWIKIIKKKKFVKDVVLLNYNQNNLKEAGEFVIELLTY